MQHIHEEAAPGAERESSELDPALPLRQQVALLNSREESYLTSLRNWLRIYRRWRARSWMIGGEVFQNGPAHMALHGCAGSDASWCHLPGFPGRLGTHLLAMARKMVHRWWRAVLAWPGSHSPTRLRRLRCALAWPALFPVPMDVP